MSFQVMWSAAFLSIAVAIAFFIIYARNAKKSAKDPAWNDLERRFSCDKNAMQGVAFTECFFFYRRSTDVRYRYINGVALAEDGGYLLIKLGVLDPYMKNMRIPVGSLASKGVDRIFLKKRKVYIVAGVDVVIAY